MARKKSSGGGCLGTIILFIIIGGIIGTIAEYLPYVALICGCVFIIWIIVKLINKNNSSSTTRAVNNVQTTNNTKIERVNNASQSNFVQAEVDRQIRDILDKRKNIQETIKTIDKEIAKHNTILNRNKTEHIKIRGELGEERRKQCNKLAASVFTFHEASTPNYERMKAAVWKLDKAQFKTYDASPSLNSLFCNYTVMGNDMQFIKFDVEPVCICISDKIFCLTPHYVVEFSKSGKYLQTYKPAVFVAGMTNGNWTERVAHQTWLHTRVDGQPDRRYSYNPRQTYYTNVPHVVYNMLDLKIPGFEVKYEIDGTLKNEVIQTVRAYATTVAKSSFDPVYHLVRLLEMCDLSNDYIKNLKDVT